jgi:hypothetical protein
MTAADYFAAKLAFETDAADVAEALATDTPGFTLIDARSEDAYAAGHIPGALNRPDELPDGAIVVYCWGPGCNGATGPARDTRSRATTPTRSRPAPTPTAS